MLASLYMRKVNPRSLRDKGKRIRGHRGCDGSNERMSLKSSAEVFDLFNHPNFQQNAVDNVQYATAKLDSTNNWTATPNPHFGAGLAMAPHYGSRAFQFSTRFSF